MRLFEIVAGLLTTVLVAFAFASPRTAVEPPGQVPVKEFSVEARRFEFVPNRLEVNQGDHVKVTIHSADGTHGFEIKQFGIKEKAKRGGEPVTVEFDATRPGTFEIKCSEYCGRGHSHMTGTLVVNAATEGARR